MARKKQPKETIKVSSEHISHCRDIRELYGQAMQQAAAAGWKDYKFLKHHKGRVVIIEKIK